MVVEDRFRIGVARGSSEVTPAAVKRVFCGGAASSSEQAGEHLADPCGLFCGGGAFGVITSFLFLRARSSEEPRTQKLRNL